VDVHFAQLFDAARAGDLDRARDLVAELLAQDERWRTYLRALADLDYLPHADELLR
jgi:DNA polymerase III delta subunit